LEKELSLEEFRWATKTIKRGKVSGVDRLEIEVFKEVDYTLKTWWTVYNEMKGKLSRLMKMGKMVLFYKKGDREDLVNYRLITMLNSDYKIVVKVLVNRL
jgi:hypothetical protein